MKHAKLLQVALRTTLGLCTVAWMTSVRGADAQPVSEGKSPQGIVAKAAAPDGDKEWFVFTGGELGDFINEMDKFFGIDVRKVATIDVSRGTQIPKMRLRIGARFPEVPGSVDTTHPIGYVLQAYNSVARNGRPEMGNWFLKSNGGWIDGAGEGNLPGIIILTPIAGARREDPIRIRAFSVNGMSTIQRERIEFAVRETEEITRKLNLERGLEINERGSLFFNPATDLLIASGPGAYLDMVETLVNAYKDSLQAPSLRTTPVPADSKKENSPTP